MQRHMQNLSFIAIVGVLLGCAFFFSRLTSLEVDSNDITIPTLKKKIDLEDITLCDDQVLSEDDTLACLKEAVQGSSLLVAQKVDELLALETEQDQLTRILEMQSAWEESRAADCELVRMMAEDDPHPEIKEADCLLGHNLARLDQLEKILCDGYDEPSCQDVSSSTD